MLYRSLKVLHLVGLTLFLGSIFGHIVSSVLGGQAGNSAAFITAREHIQVATYALTLPGLALAVLSGAGMMIVARMNPTRVPWLAVHAGLAAVVAFLAAKFIVPNVQKILADALAAAPVDTIAQIKLFEDIAGSINVLLTLAIIVIGVYKPAMFRRKAAVR
jgi:hypothetical protein